MRLEPSLRGDPGLVPIEPSLGTAAWYGDLRFALPVPRDWNVTVHEPVLPPPLGADEIAGAIRAPVGAPPLRELASGAARVAVVVDDLTRPTPVASILPVVLDELDVAGVDRTGVTVVVATGTHGRASADAIARKLGDAARGCRTIAHDDRAGGVRAGRTSRGTTVVVDRVVAAADLVIGIGGVYPQHSTGFGGGSKIVLGVLNRSTIAQLHFRHPSMDGRYTVENAFRADLDEIADLVGLRWSVLAHVDAGRRIVRLVAGDPRRTYPGAASFSRTAFAAPPPGDADVVIANAYPIDTSATFMRSKGIIPLLHARSGASRVLLAACPEGIGHHGLFPFETPTRVGAVRRRITMTRARGWPEVVRLARAVAVRGSRAAGRRLHARTGPTTAVPSPHRLPPAHPILMLRTIDGASAPGDLPASLPGMRVLRSWMDVVDQVRAEQAGTQRLDVVVYACAPLQVFESDGAGPVVGEVGS